NGYIVFSFLYIRTTSGCKGMIKMKLQKTKENEVYYYYLKNGDKRFMFRHKYVDNLGKRREKKKSGFKTQKDALRYLLVVKTTILSGKNNQIKHMNINVSHIFVLLFC